MGDATMALLARLRGDVARSGRLGPSVDAEDRGTAYALPWHGVAEPFFGQGGRATIHAPDPEIEAVLAAGGRQALFYGYPVEVDADRRLRPLVYCRVAASRGMTGDIRLMAERGWRARIHHACLARAGIDAAERETLIEELEHGGFDSFRAFLDHLAGLLGIDRRFVPDRLPAKPTGYLGPGWHDAAVLIAGSALPTRPWGPALRAAEGELDRLGRRPPDAARPTAMAALASPSAAPSAPPTITPVEPAVLSAADARTLKAALIAPLAAIDAPETAGADAFLCDLAASAVVDGQSVLYVAPSEAVDRLAEAMATLLGPAAPVLPRLGAPRLGGGAPRSVAEEPDDAPTDRPGAEAPTLGTLGDLRRRAADGERSAEALHDALIRLLDAQRRRLGLEGSVDPDWASLFRSDHALGLSRQVIAQWRMRLGAPPDSPGRLSRMVGRRQPEPFDPAMAVAILQEAMVPLPQDVIETLPLPGEDAPREVLRAAFDQLALFVEWQGAVEEELDAADAVEAEPLADALHRHSVDGRTAVSRASRRLLPDRWGSVAGAGPDSDAAALEALADLFERRRDTGSQGGEDPGRDQAVARAIATATRRFPLWSGSPADVSATLPLATALFDLVIVDGAEALPAPLLPGLLHRGRRACVIGRRPVARDGLGDAFALVSGARSAVKGRLDDPRPRHPALAAYLARRFGLASRATETLGPPADALPPHVLGIRRHTPPEFGAHGEVAAAVELLRGWKTAGLVDLQPRPTIAVLTTTADLADRLRRTLKAVVPSSLAERGVVVSTGEGLGVESVDLVVVLPGLGAAALTDREERLARSEALYGRALRTARLGIHVIGQRDAALAAGGHLAALVRAAEATRRSPEPALQSLAALCRRAALPCIADDRGLIAFGPFGGLYALGFLDSAPETDPDDPITPVLFDRADLTERPDTILARLVRLV
ncbi:MAG: hypothetical protein RID91_05340 [Azospirillaceae bacterium]